MLQLCTNKDMVFIAMSGMTYSFKAGIPRSLPEADAAEFRERYETCLETNKPISDVSQVSESFTVSEVKQTEKTSNIVKFDKLEDALKSIIDNGNTKDFKVDGLPKINVVNNLLNKKYSANEINAKYWEIIHDDSH